MRNLLRQMVLLKLLALPSLSTWAASTIYVDPACPTGGNGSSATCSASPTTNNPKRFLHDIFPSAEACDTIYLLRGVHSSHDNCPGFDGKYFGKEWAHDQSCSSGTSTIIRPYNYSSGTYGSGERVTLVGGRCPKPSWCTGTNCDYSVSGSASNCGTGDGTNGAWKHCTWDGSLCDCANLNIVVGNGTQAACEEVWWTSDAGTSGTNFQPSGPGGVSDVLYGIKDDGSMTYTTSTVANNDACTGAGSPHACCTGTDAGTCLLDLTNSHGGYVSARCSVRTWMPCVTAADCVSGETCTATSAEIDSYRDTAPTPDVLYVRWGASGSAQAPGTAARPYVPHSPDGKVGFTAKAASDYFTIEGFDFVVHANASVYMDGDTADTGKGHTTVQDNKVYYGAGTGGSDYGILSRESNGAIIQRNEIAYTASEGVHCNARAVSSTSLVDILDNYIHNQGDTNVMGANPGAGAGTPVGITCNNAETRDNGGDFTGSDIAGNFIRDIKTIPGVQNSAYGIRMEHCMNNMRIHDNVLLRAGNQYSGLIDGSPQSTACDQAGDGSTGLEWYNNLFLECGAECLRFFSSTQIVGSKVYNNTFYSPGSNACIHTADVTGTYDDNLIRNNLMSCGSLKCINWTENDVNSTGNVFENNVCHTSGTNAATIAAMTYTRSDFDGDCSGVCPNSKCNTSVDATYLKFVNAGGYDFHIQTDSPAKDAGTSTGMPSGRTTDINNTLASQHGLTDYSDGHEQLDGAWDIGADEFSGGTVAFDAFTSGTATSFSLLSWTHTPVATPEGVLVIVVLTGADESVSSVYYGGHALTEVQSSPLVHDSGETGTVAAFLLDSNVPSGNQTVSVTKSGTTANVQAGCWTMTVAGASSVRHVATEVSIVSSSEANPRATLELRGLVSFVAQGFFSGQNATSSITPLSDWTAAREEDFGSQTGGWYTYNTIGEADVLIGWDQSADDAACIAVAIRGGP